MAHEVSLRRAYDPPGKDDGYRVLVDRVWPRGVSRDELAIDEWARDIAPTTELRKWYNHDTARWDEFRARYRAELSDGAASDALDALVERARSAPLTLVFGARDAEHSQAAALREFIEERTKNR